MRLPFFYGWLIVAVVFVTMGIGVNARTAFSLLFPPILEEFRWDRGVTAGAFSFGFVVSAILSPVLGRMMDRVGPRAVMELGVGLMAAGLLLAPLTREPWHLYLTLGVLVGGGSVCLGYSGQSLFLPNWFVRRRGLAIGIAFAGVGVGSITLLPWVQLVIEGAGWRAACMAMGTLLLVVLAPINLLLRKRPEDMGLRPDGDAAPSSSAAPPPSNVVNEAWAAVDWTLGRAMRTAPFWWIALGVFLRPLRLVRGAGAPDQVPGGDRLQPDRGGVGAGPRQPVRHSRARSRSATSPTASAGNGYGPSAALGFAICFLALIALEHNPTPMLLYVMVAAQGGARLRPDLDLRRGGGRDLPGQALRQHLRHADAGGDRRRRARALGHRRAVRRARELRAGLLDLRRAQRPVGGGDLAGGPAQGARRRRPDASPAASGGAGIGKMQLAHGRWMGGGRAFTGKACVTGRGGCVGMRLPSADGTAH